METDTEVEIAENNSSIMDTDFHRTRVKSFDAGKSNLGRGGGGEIDSVKLFPSFFVLSRCSKSTSLVASFKLLLDVDSALGASVQMEIRLYLCSSTHHIHPVEHDAPLWT